MAAANASAPEHDDPVTADAPAPAAAPHALEYAGISVAVWTPAVDAENLVDGAFEAARSFAASGGSLLVLPALFCFPDGSLDDPQEASETFVPVVRALCEACEGSGLHIATSLVEATQQGTATHVGVLLSAAGIVARQPQLEAVERYSWTPLGERQAVWDMPYGRLAMLVGDDVLHPERVRVAMERADIVVCAAEAFGAGPGWGEAPEVLRAAREACVCVVAAGGGEHGGGGFVADVVARDSGERLEGVPASEGEALTHAPQSVTRVETPGGLTQAQISPGKARRAPDEAAEPPAPPKGADEQPVATAADDENIAAHDAPLESPAGAGAKSPGTDDAEAAKHETTPDDQAPVNEAGEVTETSAEPTPQ